MLNYPLTLSFKILAISPQVRILDSMGQTVMYVKQKALALKEDVRIFADDQQQQQLYQIKANKVFDFSARYNITRPDGQVVGAIQREGMKSLWKATFHIFDAQGNQVGKIHEENPLLKLLDALASEVPFLSMLVNPAYLVEWDGQQVLYFKKEPAMMEGRFTIHHRAELSEAQEELLLASVIMMMMLERQRG